MNYLILLKDDEEANSWMKEDIEGCIILTNSKRSDFQKCPFEEPLPLQEDIEWIVVAYVEKPENGKENQQKKLKEKIGDKSYKIFHHGGSLNAGKTTTQGVYKKFDEAGFVEAGFSPDNLMCFSEKGNFPWGDDIENVRKIFAQKVADNGDYDNALKNLESAWNQARVYFNIDKPIEKVIEGLFPLYVDAINLTPSTEADWNAALTAAWGNLNRLLDELGPLDANQLLTTWKEVVAQVNNKAKPLVHAVIGLLNHCITALEVTQAARTGIHDEERERFIAMFKFLSDAYYSKHPEFSVPPK